MSTTRRAMLKAIAAAAAGCAAGAPPLAFGAADWRTPVLKYLQRLARPDSGYAWEDQEASHLTPTFAVIACYRLLGQDPPNRAALAEFVRTHHPARLKKREQEHHDYDWQQIQSLAWLGEDVSSFREKVAGWTKPYVYLKQYEQQGFPILRSELAVFPCRQLLGMPVKELAPFIEYLDSRRRQSGSFNNTPAADGTDGHVMNTWWGLRALATLGRADERKDAAVAWLQSCQLPGGGFTYQPNATAGGWDDVAYTWAAVRSLHQLGSAPARREACINYVRSLWNADGGFGDRPGWLSNPVASYYALDTLKALEALDTLAPSPRPATFPPAARAPLPADLKVFSMQIEAHGQGSPTEAVDLARALRIHLWGAKNARPEWLARAQAIADREKVPVRFFVANEEYGTWVTVPGLGTYSHTSDLVAPAGVDIGRPLKDGAVTWEDFRERRLAPLQKAGGRLVWQFGENEELVRLYLDDSLRRGGYAAISTFHFGNPDFTNTEPFLNRWRGHIPFVALQDAHGSEPWWFADMTTGFRTLFLGTEPTWDAWLAALKENWVVAVRHDAVSGMKTWMHGGSREVTDFVRAHEQEWRWWDNAQIERPLVSIVAVKPDDAFEAGRPERGVLIRVRCAWENTTQGLPKKPIAELVELKVDGERVAPALVAPRPQRGAVAQADYRHQYHLPDPAPGKHTATARVRVIATRAESERSIQFTA